MIDFKSLEEKWQKKWEKEKVFESKENSKKPKCYVLEMFPYPSGSGLHMGHAWNYTIGDILARFKRMQGFNVLHPMGYDALGLPAENAAIQVGELPQNYTSKSIKNYIQQQKALGLSYDWTRMVNTSDSKYYKWDQWIFLKMFEKGLAYQKEAAVNWCSKCNSVLANEQVHEGKCWRHEDTDVEIKHLKQWFLKITNYADELYESLDNLKEWPEKTKAMQRNWIGKSSGTEIDFEINGKKWGVFTTRPDTLFGVTFMMVSAQHPKLFDLVTKEQKKEVDKFLKKLKSVSEKDVGDLEKEGVFTGSYAINPATNEKIPIWAANFVIADYGSGMVMADAHDQRDLEFAHKYKINLKETILPENKKSSDPNKSLRAFTNYGILTNSGKFDGLKSKDAIDKITDWLIKEKKGRRIINFKLRDWGISRQRYWGTPIPIIHCSKCGIVPVLEKDLPVELPKEVKFGKGNPLETNNKWLNAKCPKCKSKARRETETMDTFVNSSWYFLRYCDPLNDKFIFDKKKVNYWCPVDFYIGGAEHACMHLIYFRFYVKFLADIGLLNFREPAKGLFHQGMLHAEGGAKMSKSKGNVVLPEKVSNNYGIDTARFFLCSLASPDKDIDWSEQGIIGSLRFIKKIFEFSDNLKFGKDSENLIRKLNLTIKNITQYFSSFEYRKSSIELRELFDLIYEQKEISKDSFEKFLKLLNPICPHITEEIWEKIGNKNFISNSNWPKWEESKINILKSNLDLSEKYSKLIKDLMSKVEAKGNSFSKIYLYVVPFEVTKLNKVKIAKEIGKDVEIFSLKDEDKYDPENRAKKAIPGLPGVYFE